MKVRKAVIPAAGLGTRFLPATKAMPKEMLPVVDKPAIQYVVEEAVEAGIRDILIVIGRSKRAIEDHFDKSVELEMALQKSGRKGLLEMIDRISGMADITYVRQKEPLGLAHAVSLAKRFVGDEPFAVLLGDDIVMSEVPGIRQLCGLHEKNDSTVIAVEEVPPSEISLYGAVKFGKHEGRVYEIEDIVEKPAAGFAPSNVAVLGRYVFTPEIFDAAEKIKPVRGEYLIADAMRALLERGRRIYGYRIDGRRFDIGNKAGYMKTVVHFGLRHPEIGKEFGEYLRELAKSGYLA